MPLGRGLVPHLQKEDHPHWEGLHSAKTHLTADPVEATSCSRDPGPSHPRRCPRKVKLTKTAAFNMRVRKTKLRWTYSTQRGVSSEKTCQQLGAHTR